MAEVAGWTVEQVKALLEERMRDVETRFNLRLDLEQKALRVALDTNEHRLADMNEFRAALSDQAGRMMRRTESEQAFASMGARFDAQLSPIKTNVEALGRTNWAQLTSVASLGFVLVAGIWLIIGLKIESANSPQLLNIEQLKIGNASRDRQISDISTTANRAQQENTLQAQALATVSAVQQSRSGIVENMARQVQASSAADESSRGDRLQLNNRVTAMEARQSVNSSERREAAATTRAKLVEVETQFKALSDVLNLNRDDVQQWMTILWARAYPGEILPPRNFRPNLYRELPP